MNPAKELDFRKSSYSGGPQQSCVEVAAAGGRRFVVRDSKDKTGPTLEFKDEDISAFLEGVSR